MRPIKSLFVFALLVIHVSVVAQQGKQVIKDNGIKNVIILIPDGASIDLVTLSRWYNNNQPLAVDSIICGMIKTHNIDNKMPDSAPTSTAYATGERSDKKHIGVDSSAVPHISVLELARLKGLSTGIIVTCEFPHATPADFVCHFYDRDNYKNLAKQFIFNSPSIVFSGGKAVIDENNYNGLLKSENIRLITDKDTFINFTKLPEEGKSVWALFPDWKGRTKSKSYECDRNAKEPGLSEMTKKAIELLSQNEKGFFLMVEGSQIDWACHNNDPYAAVTDFLEFDRAVHMALQFAKSNSNTLVIVCPDHGNGGISIGNARSHTDFIKNNPDKYDNIDISKRIISPLKQVKYSARKLAEKIIDDLLYAHADTIYKYYNIKLPQQTVNLIRNIRKLNSDKKSDTIQYILGSNFSYQNFIGWTTTGHTAEDVFLGIYAPQQVHRITGVVDNSSIAYYIAEQLKLGNLQDSTDTYFCPHNSIFKNDEIIQINQDSLVIKKNGVKLVIYANTNKIKITKNNTAAEREQPTIAVCIQKENKQMTYYIPKKTMHFFE